LLCVLSLSCASERLLEKSGPTPDWVLQPPRPTPTKLLFTGQAVGRNVLDERTMRTRAMEDARQQVASMIGTQVTAKTRQSLLKSGHEAHGADQVLEARYVSQIRTTVQQQVHAVRLEGKYWEKWAIDPGLLRRSFVRYKYFVLASYPQDEYERNLSYFARLVTDQQLAVDLMKLGRPRQAARVLERLLNDYPKASVQIRLTLADAYEQAQRPDRAADALRTASRLTSDPAEQARIGERIDRLENALPDLAGSSAWVVIDWGEGAPTHREMARTWIEETFSESHVDLIAMESGPSRGASERSIAQAPKAGAQWFVVVQLSVEPSATTKWRYGVELHEASVECAVRVLSAEDARVLTSTLAVGRKLASDRDSAVRLAMRSAIRSALRTCFLALVRDVE